LRAIPARAKARQCSKEDRSKEWERTEIMHMKRYKKARKGRRKRSGEGKTEGN